MKPITPNRPYLLRAYYEWLMDNHLTPHVVVDAFVKGTQVPQQFVKDGQIVLNIATGAVANLHMTNDAVEFNARFGGVPVHVYVPILAVLAVYSKETGEGMGFGFEPGIPSPDGHNPLPAPISAVDKPKPKSSGTVSSIGSHTKRPAFKVVK